MFEGFETFDVEVSTSAAVTIHGVKAGTGPPLLLLHGYPQTHVIWHKIAPRLAQSYTVIAMDLRGYGASSKPPSTSPNHAVYSKSSMAHDCVTLMREHFHFPSFFICAHDRGARVAHKLLLDHPSAVRKAILLDICPTAAMYGQTDFRFAKAYYHWFFLIQPAPFPENMIRGNVDAFMDAHMGFIKHPDRKDSGAEAVFGTEALGLYKAAMRGDNDKDSLAAVHASCEDYRAAASVDLEEHAEDEKAGRRIVVPLLVLWGDRGIVGKCFNPLVEWRKVTDPDVPVVGEGVESGHYIPEEQPEVTLRKIVEFLRD